MKNKNKAKISYEPEIACIVKLVNTLDDRLECLQCFKI